jgi:hypothetical protein
VLLVSGVAAFVAVSQGRRANCSGAPGTPAPSWLSEPLTLGPREAVAAPGDVAAMPVDATNDGGAVFDPAAVTQVLDDADLHEVRALVARDAYQAAADRLEALLDKGERESAAPTASAAPAIRGRRSPRLRP